MANTLLLKRRIKTARNVSKTTRAMQMIATAKLKTAQNVTLESRPYMEFLSKTLGDLTLKIPPKELPYYMKNITEPKKNLVIIISPDKGLCGGLVTNLIKETLNLDSGRENYFMTIGKKIENYVVRSNKELIASFKFGTTLPSLNMVYPVTRIINEYFLNRKVKKVKLLFTYFDGIFSQKPKIIDVLPLIPESQIENKISETMIFEPNLSTILNFLIKKYIENILYQSLLESFLSEQAARTIAMQNATNNAKDIIYNLTLEYNKARQEKITKEILDISGTIVSI